MAITNAILTTGTAANVLYSTSTSSKAVTAVYLCNPTGAAVTANVYVVPAGNNSIGNCLIYSNLIIASSDTSIADSERLILEAGDAVYANCSAVNGIIMTISSVGI